MANLSNQMVLACQRLSTARSMIARGAAGLLSLARVLLAAGAHAELTNLPRRLICLISGSAEYESEKSLSAFEAFFRANYRITFGGGCDA
jgi:hypothetical protein